MSNPALRSFSESYANPGMDAWHIRQGPLGKVVGWVDSAGVPQGTLAQGMFGLGTFASQFLGDLGAQINAASAAIGSGNSGTIVVADGGGVMTTPVVLGKAHRLLLGAGVYTTAGICFSDSTTDTSGTGSLQGVSAQLTRLVLAAGSNTDVVSQVNFVALTSTGNVNGLWRPEIKDLTIDGNAFNNSSGYGIRLYGWAIHLQNVVVQNCVNDGIYTEWGQDRPGNGVDTQMEPHYSNIVSMNNGGNGWTNYGPHDAVFSGLTCKQNVGWGWVNGGTITGQVGNGAGFHAFNWNIWNNALGGIWIRQAGTVYDPSISAGPSVTAVLIDSGAGPCQLIGGTITSAGIGIESRSGGHVLICDLENNSIGFKINGGYGNHVICGNSVSNAVHILVALDGGTNYVQFQALGTGTTVSGLFASSDTLFIRGAADSYSLTQIPGSVLPSSTTSTSASAGSSGAVPNQVVGYLEFLIGSTTFKIPYYAS